VVRSLTKGSGRLDTRLPSQDKLRSIGAARKTSVKARSYSGSMSGAERQCQASIKK